MKKSIDETMSKLIDFVSDAKIDENIVRAYYVGCITTVADFLRSKEDFETTELLVKISGYIESLEGKASREQLLNNVLEVKEMLTPNEKINANHYFK